MEWIGTSDILLLGSHKTISVIQLFLSSECTSEYNPFDHPVDLEIFVLYEIIQFRRLNKADITEVTHQN